VVRRLFKRTTKDALGRTLTPHSARHTAASNMIAAGESIITVSQHLGHAKVSTTLDIYGQAKLEHHVEAAARRGERMYGGRKR
jgi:integrase